MTTPAQTGPTPRAVNGLFAPWNKPGSPGCAVAVVRDGKIVYEHGFGQANLEYGLPITPKTPFLIASMSKQFTACCIHLLAEDGKLSLDDDIRKYLPEMHDFGKPLTIRHLLHHTSGLREYSSLLAMSGRRDEDVITRDDVVPLVLRQRGLNFEPGSAFMYGNTNYVLLGEIVRRVSGESLGAFARRRIFGPLHMDGTTLPDDYHALVPGRACSYAPAAGGFARRVDATAGLGDGSVFTTVEDLAKWDANFYAPRVGTPKMIAAMLTPGRLNDGTVLDYASGLFLDEYRGLRIVHHGGAFAGFNAQLLRFPDQHFSVIVLANVSNFDADAMAQKVADLYLRDQMTPSPPAAPPGHSAPPVEVTVDPRVYDAYAGAYQLFPGVVLTVTRQDGRLLVQTPGQDASEIFPSSETEFFSRVGDARIRFVRDSAGAVSEIIVHQHGRDIPAPRLTGAWLTSAAVAEYTAGYYSDELGLLYTVFTRGGRLFLRYPRGEMPLLPVSPDEFACALGNVRFRRNDRKQVDGLAVDTPPARDQRFARVDLATAP